MYESRRRKKSNERIAAIVERVRHVKEDMLSSIPPPKKSGPIEIIPDDVAHPEKDDAEEG